MLSMAPRARYIQRGSKIIQIMSLQGSRGGPSGVTILLIGFPIKATSATALAEGLEVNTTLVELNLLNNRISDAGAISSGSCWVRTTSNAN